MPLEQIAITPLYAGLFGLILIYLSWRVVRTRNKYQIKMGDGGHAELIAATRAHGNFLEYLPTALLLLFFMELMGFSAALVHGLGFLLLAARSLHLKGIRAPSGASLSRKIGTRLTWLQMTIASLLCILGAYGIVF